VRLDNPESGLSYQRLGEQPSVPEARPGEKAERQAPGSNPVERLAEGLIEWGRRRGWSHGRVRRSSHFLARFEASQAVLVGRMEEMSLPSGALGRRLGGADRNLKNERMRSPKL
jgi:hypothetical protein